jgi:hypothetical protein
LVNSIEASRLSFTETVPPPPVRNQRIEARRAARDLKARRERLIVDCLNRGLSMAEIATRIGVTEKRMRAIVPEILARRMPTAPEEFAAIQVGRLNEALLVAYAAMSPQNLRAVALMVRIVRELDRYHGFTPVQKRFTVDRINDPNFVAGIDANQGPTLIGKFKELFHGEADNIKTLDKVAIMTPENIHVNAFMYEPIIDMSDDSLRKLYGRVKVLKLTNVKKINSK